MADCFAAPPVSGAARARLRTDSGVCEEIPACRVMIYKKDVGRDIARIARPAFAVEPILSFVFGYVVRFSTGGKR